MVALKALGQGIGLGLSKIYALFLSGPRAPLTRPSSLPIPHRQDHPPAGQEFPELAFRLPRCSKFFKANNNGSGP